MACLGEGVEQACRELDPALRRVNLEILGNTDPFLHAQVWPRYDWEPSDIVGRPVWLYPAEKWSDPTTQLSSKHATFRDLITKRLEAYRP
jgi:hypothetical protein